MLSYACSSPRWTCMMNAVNIICFIVFSSALYFFSLTTSNKALGTQILKLYTKKSLHSAQKREIQIKSLCNITNIIYIDIECGKWFSMLRYEQQTFRKCVFKQITSTAFFWVIGWVSVNPKFYRNQRMREIEGK